MVFWNYKFSHQICPIFVQHLKFSLIEFQVWNKVENKFDFLYSIELQGTIEGSMVQLLTWEIPKRTLSTRSNLSEQGYMLQRDRVFTAWKSKSDWQNVAFRSTTSANAETESWGLPKPKISSPELLSLRSRRPQLRFRAARCCPLCTVNCTNNIRHLCTIFCT